MDDELKLLEKEDTYLELNPTARYLSPGDLSQFPECSRKTIIAEFSSGNIRIETGADGAYLLFDCDCTDALPYCKAQCCGLRGTNLLPEDLERFIYPVEVDGQSVVMKRDADGFCSCLDRRSRLCSIYEERPQVCRQFHCTRGAHQRGWKLANQVHRQSMT